jgi:uncharacterized protein
VIAPDPTVPATLAVDVHAHLGPADRPGRDDGRLGALLTAMDATGIDHACVFASAGRGSDYPAETELIAEAAGRTGGRVVPFARVHPFWRQQAVADLRAAVASGARGLKLHPFMDGAFMANDPELVHPLLRVAAESGLVVLVHSGWSWNSAPGLVASLAHSFPEVPIIVGHAGRYGWHREAAAVGAELANLHYDVAGLAVPGAIEELARLVGPERILFGTDHPYSPIGFELEKLLRWVRLPWPSLAMIVGGNAARLLGLGPDGHGPTRHVPPALAAAG